MNIWFGAEITMSSGKAGPPHIAPDGERFACGDTVGNVTVLDARTYERHGVLPGSAHPWSLRFLPVGRLAVACFDGHIRVWDPDTLALVERLSGHDFIVRSMARLPGAAALVSGAALRTLSRLSIWTVIWLSSIRSADCDPDVS